MRLRNQIYLLIISLLFITNVCFAELSEADRTAINNSIRIVEKAVRESKTAEILGEVSPDAVLGLSEEIRNRFEGKSIWFQQDIDKFEEMEDGRIKVKGKYAASGSNWRLTGFSNYYIYEKTPQGEWKIYDTNFHEMGAGNVFKLLGIIFGSIIGLFLIAGIIVLVVVKKKKRKKEQAGMNRYIR